MPLFGRKENPEDLQIREETRQRISDYIAGFRAEDQRLKELGLPVPTSQEEFEVSDLLCLSHNTSLRSLWNGEKIEPRCDKARKNERCSAAISVMPPTFTIPPHVAIFLHRGVSNQYRRNDNEPLGYAFLPTAGTEIIPEDVTESNVFNYLHSYPFRYFNRHPYVNYIHTTVTSEYDGFKKHPWIFYAGDDEMPSRMTFDNTRLEEISIFSPGEVRAMFFGQQLLGKLSTHYRASGFFIANYYKYPFPQNNFVQVIGLNIYDEILLDLSRQRFNFEFSPQPFSLKIIPPQETKASVTGQFFDSLHHATGPVAFEIRADNAISFFLTCDCKDRAYIEEQLQLHLPNCISQYSFRNEISEIWSRVRFSASPLYRCCVSTDKANLSFRKLSELGVDPYSQLFNRLRETSEDNIARLQFIINPLGNDTIKVIHDHLENVANDEGMYDRDRKPVKEAVRSLDQKTPAYLVSINLFASSAELLDQIYQTFFKPFETPEKRFTSTPVTRTNIIDHKLEPWSFLSTEELVALAHFPTQAIDSDKLEIASMKAKHPPDSYAKDGIRIGTSDAKGTQKPVSIPYSVRDRHTYVVGKSGTGKSTLLYNCICQDIQSGAGVAVIDPHGDLVSDVLNFIPESRIEDTIYFNTADKHFPIGLNIVNAQTEEEIGLLADDLLVTFRRMSESWGERMDTILRYTFHTLLRMEEATLLDVANLLQDERYRTKALRQINSPLIHKFWEEQYENYPRDAAQPVLNRLAKFALSPILSGILNQADAPLNFFDVIQNKKILLVNLSKGLIGEDAAQLLGSLIVSQLQMSIMRRAAMPKEARDPYYLYVDEFQNFTTSAFEKILSEARKFKLCLTLAHQYISQLDEKTKNAIVGNVGTIIMFYSDSKDAAALRPELGQYEPTDVTNLDTTRHEALCKPATQSKDTFKFQTLAPIRGGQNNVAAIIEYTRENYSTGPGVPPEAPRMKPEAAQSPELTSPEPERQAPRRPAPALPKEFANTGDKILHYVGQAEWLATPQIHQLCYSHVKEESRKSSASRDIKPLIEGKRLKFQNFGKGKIYYTGRQVNPTTHNLAIRDLFTKIVGSGFELAEVNFFPKLSGLTPDLVVSFLAEDGGLIESFWEYDAGTEGIAELLKKVNRYSSLDGDPLVVFVFNTRERLLQFAKAAGSPRIVVAVINEFSTLVDPAFVFLQGGNSASEASGLFPS